MFTHITIILIGLQLLGGIHLTRVRSSIESAGGTSTKRTGAWDEPMIPSACHDHAIEHGLLGNPPRDCMVFRFFCSTEVNEKTTKPRTYQDLKVPGMFKIQKVVTQTKHRSRTEEWLVS